MLRSRPSGDLREPDGRGDGAADRHHRDGLCHRAPRPEGRWPDGGRCAAAHARRYAGQRAALARDVGRWEPTRARAASSSSCRRASRAASLTATSSCALPPMRDVLPARVPAGRIDRCRRGADEGDQGLFAAAAASPPAMEFLNGSRQDIQTSFTTSTISSCWPGSWNASRARSSAAQTASCSERASEGQPFAPEKTPASPRRRSRRHRRASPSLAQPASSTIPIASGGGARGDDLHRHAGQHAADRRPQTST